MKAQKEEKKLRRPMRPLAPSAEIPRYLSIIDIDMGSIKAGIYICVQFENIIRLIFFIDYCFFLIFSLLVNVFMVHRHQLLTTCQILYGIINTDDSSIVRIHAIQGKEY